MSLDGYWQLYDTTLARVREEKPQTYDALKAILDSFQPPSSAEAFFPGGADETLAEACSAAGWGWVWSEADYFYAMRHPVTGETFTYVEGDVYRGNQRPLPANDPIPPRVTVKITDTYADGHTATREVKVDGPEVLAGIEDWWQDEVFPHTGDGHGIEHPKLGVVHEAVITEARDANLVGLRNEWVA